MKKAYRVYNEKAGEVLLSFATTSDEEAIKKSKRNVRHERTQLRKMERNTRPESMDKNKLKKKNSPDPPTGDTGRTFFTSRGSC